MICKCEGHVSIKWVIKMITRTKNEPCHVTRNTSLQAHIKFLQLSMNLLKQHLIWPFISQTYHKTFCPKPCQNQLTHLNGKKRNYTSLTWYIPGEPMWTLEDHFFSRYVFMNHLSKDQIKNCLKSFGTSDTGHNCSKITKPFISVSHFNPRALTS